MKLALTTIITNSYTLGCKAMINSFLKFNNFKGDIVIYCCDKKINKNLFKIYKNVKFIDIYNLNFNKENFYNKTYCTLNNEYNANNRFEIFKLKYDQILFVDSDVIFNGNTLSLLQPHNKFLVVSSSPQHKKSVSKKQYFDAGIMSISKKFLSLKIYNKILKFSKFKKFRDDEEILNLFFKNNVTFINKKFNTLTHEIKTSAFKKYKAIQFVGEKKPWHGNKIEECFDAFNIKEILKNKNGLLILTKLKKLYNLYE